MKFEFDKYEIPNSLKVYTLPTEANNGQILETSYNPEYIVVNGVTQSATYSFSGLGGDPLGSTLTYKIALDFYTDRWPRQIISITDNTGFVYSTGWSTEIIDNNNGQAYLIKVTHPLAKMIINVQCHAYSFDYIQNPYITSISPIGDNIGNQDIITFRQNQELNEFYIYNFKNDTGLGGVRLGLITFQTL